MGETKQPDNSSGQPSEFSIEEILRNVGVGLYQYRLFLVCGMACTADAIEISLLSFMSPCAKEEWNLSDGEASSITSVVFAGQLAGSLFWGPLADRYGRRKMSAACGTIISLAGLLSAFAPNLDILLLTRFLVGFGVGGFTIPFDLLAEFIPTKYRTRFLMSVSFFWSLGSMFVATMAWALLDQYGWRALTGVVSIPVALAVVMTFFLPESPRWLLSKQREDEAIEVLSRVATFNGVSLPGNFSLVHNNFDEHEGLLNCGKLISPAFRKITLALWTVWFSFGFTYYGAILLTSKIFEKGPTSSGTCSFEYEDIFVSASSEIAALILAMNVMHKLGRRLYQLLAYGSSGIFTVLIGYFAFHDASVAFISVLAALMRMGVFLGSNATWIQTPELYPTDIRGTGHSAANAFARIGGALIPYWVYAPFNLVIISTVIGIFNILAGLSAMLQKETANLALDNEDEVETRSKSFNLQQPPEYEDELKKEQSSNSNSSQEPNRFLGQGGAEGLELSLQTSGDKKTEATLV